jgi:hypothetical protein
VTAVYLPHTDHMLDAGTKWSPAARVAMYALERFLAVMADTEKRSSTSTYDAATPATTNRLLPATQAFERNQHEEAPNHL